MQIGINRLAFFFASLIFSVHLAAKPLTLEIYNAGAEATFPVTSVLIKGEKEVLLVDTQFEKKHARELVKKIRESGKTLSLIYISHSDPDYYFGADVLMKAFPDAQLFATSATIASIASTYKEKEAYWKDTLKEEAPDQVILPKPVIGQELILENQRIEIIGVNEPDPNRTFLWIPSLKTILGGISLTANSHLWIGDSATAESRFTWLKILDEMEKLEPRTVIPGHYLLNNDGSIPDTPASIKFTRDYLITLDEENKKSENSRQLIDALEQHYPELAGKETLLFSAKVIKGDENDPGNTKN